MDRTGRDHLGTRGDRADNTHIALFEHDRLAGAHRLIDQQRRTVLWRRRTWFVWHVHVPGGALAVGMQRRPRLESLPRWMCALGTDDANAAAGQPFQQSRDIGLLTRQ